MKKNILKILPLISILMIFLFAISSINIFGFLPNKTFASSEQTNQNLTIDLLDRDGNLVMVEENEATFNGRKAFIYQWETTSDFKLNIDASKKVPPKKYNKDGEESYTITIEVEYKLGYYTSARWTNYSSLVLYSKTATGAKSYESFSSVNPVLNIDDGIIGKDTATGEETKISTWGIYRFRMVINDQDTYSDFFAIEPKLEIAEKPIITYKTTPSKISLHNAYNYSLKNANAYKYVDKSKLVWYALGKSEEGATYCLTFSDINSGKDDFKDCSFGLYQTYERTGQTFYFDDNGIAGQYKIWCEYNYDGNAESTLKSNISLISTGAQFDHKVVIWVVLGVAGFFILVCIGICIYKVKREKIY